MKKKTLIISLTALLSLVLAGVSFAQENEGPVKLDNSTGVSTSEYRVDPDANWQALAMTPYEADLVDTFAYQNNPEKFVRVKEDQVWAGAEKPEKSLNPCLVTKLIGTNLCRENSVTGG